MQNGDSLDHRKYNGAITGNGMGKWWEGGMEEKYRKVKQYNLCKRTNVLCLRHKIRSLRLAREFKADILVSYG